MRNDRQRKAQVFGILLLFFSAGIVSALNENPSTIFPSAKSGTWLYVGGSGPGNYTTIQSAVNAANAGDTVFVYSGIYREDIKVNTAIHLLGEDTNTTIINGLDVSIWLSVDGVEVAYFTIENSSKGIDVDSSSNIIHQCKFRFINYHGCLDSSGSNNQFINNWIYGGDPGILLTSWDAKNNFLLGNKLVNCGISLEGDSINEWNTHFIDTTNTIDGKPVYYYKNQTGGQVPSDAGEIILANCSKISVLHQNSSIRIYLGYSTNCSINNNNMNLTLFHESGIVALYSTNNIFYNNHIFGNSCNDSVDGMRFFQCDENKIIHNQISFIANGVVLDLCKNNYLIQNFITSIFRDSIFLGRSSNTTIMNNNMFGNNQGVIIVLNNSSYNTIQNNNCGNFSTGVTLNNNSCYNIVEGNTFSIQDTGIQISGYIPLAYNNLIFHNNFLNDDSWNVRCARDYSQNIWYNATLKQGNYYYDYMGVDTNNDGIGDRPYNIPGGSNQDFYPFMERDGWMFPPNPNQSPNTPTVTGKITGVIRTSYDYSIQTSDPDQDGVAYLIDWSDNNIEWKGYFSTGQICRVNHSWDSMGTYAIKVKAIDEHGLESDWATLTVTMPCSYNTHILNVFQWLFQRFPDVFPLRCYLMGY